MKLTVSLAQMEFKLGEVDSNLNRVVEWIEEASNKKSDIILLPELWASGYDIKNWHLYATALGEGVFSSLAKLARDHKIVIGSSLLEKHERMAFNTFVLFGNDGETLGVYRKIHRFRLLQEEKWLGAGDDLVLAQTPWGKVGLGICYDLRFPEMFRPYAKAGSRLILIVAEWPERRIAHWTKLIQARAIENQLFVAGVNKVGESMGVKLGGRSTIIDPWGDPLIEGKDEEGLFTVEINLNEADKARKYIPVFQDRRFDVYEKGEKQESLIFNPIDD